MLALANDCRSVLPSQIDDYNAAVSHLQEAKEKLQSVYSANIIPNKYRSVYVAYYLYDYISSSHETDIDRVLQTMLLEQIIAKLDIRAIAVQVMQELFKALAMRFSFPLPDSVKA